MLTLQSVRWWEQAHSIEASKSVCLNAVGSFLSLPHQVLHFCREEGRVFLN